MPTFGEMTKQLFHILKDGAIFCSRDSSSYIDKTAEEILENIKIENSCLAIKTNISIQPIKPKDKPLKLFPSIIGQGALEINEVENALVIQPPEFQDKIAYYFECKTQESEPIPNFAVTFAQNSLNKMSYSQFLATVAEQFDLPHSEGKLYRDEQPLSDSTPISQILKFCNEKPLIYQCKLEEKGCYKLRMRRNLITEVKTTEITYINDLNTLINFFKPQLEKTKYLTQEQLTLIFKDLPTIFSCHIHFLASIKQRGSGYGAIISDCLIEFSRFFKLSANYVSNYQQVSKIATSLPQSFMDDLIKRCPMNELGRDFSSFLITPIQRYPRYILFIRELIKFTPKCHPDSAGLELAQQKIDYVTKELEEQKDKNEHIYSIVQLQSKLDPPTTLLAPARDLLTKYKVTLPEYPKTKARLYHFTDMVLVCLRVKSKNYNVVLNELNIRVAYDPHVSPEGIVFIKEGKQMVHVVFANKDEKHEYLTKIQAERERLFSNLPNKTNCLLWSDIYIPSIPPQTLYLSGEIVNDDIYFTGGLAMKDKDRVKMPFIVYNIGTHNFSASSYLSLPIVGSTLSALSNTIYQFGGIEKESQKPNNITYMMESSNMQWKKLEVGDAIIPPRSYHTAVIHDKKMFIFGGLDEKRNELGDCYFLDLTTKRWHKVNSKGEGPKPRFSHSASVVGNYMVIHGGRAGKKKFFNDFWALDLKAFSWTRIGVKNDYIFHKRCGHRSFVAGAFLFIIGGSNKNDIGQYMDTVAIDMLSGNAEVLENCGNFPQTTQFGLVYSRGNAYIYGGKDLACDRVRSSMAFASLPERFTSTSIPPNFSVKHLEKIKEVSKEKKDRRKSEGAPPTKARDYSPQPRAHEPLAPPPKHRESFDPGDIALQLQSIHLKRVNTLESKSNLAPSKSDESKKSATSSKFQAPKYDEPKKPEPKLSGGQRPELRPIGKVDLKPVPKAELKPVPKQEPQIKKSSSKSDFGADIDQLCNELKIDISELQPFRQKFIVQKLQKLIELRNENDMYRKSAKGGGRPSKVTAGTRIAVFDAIGKSSKIVCLTSDLDYDKVLDHIKKTVPRKSASVQIRVNGKLVNLTKESFMNAISKYQLMKVVVN